MFCIRSVTLTTGFYFFCSCLCISGFCQSYVLTPMNLSFLYIFAAIFVLVSIGINTYNGSTALLKSH